MIFILLVSLYSTRELLNVLGVEDYGIYNVVAGFVSLFAFLNTSMISAVQRFYNFEKGKGNLRGLNHVFNTSLQIQLILAFVTFLLLETLGTWYINNKMVIPVERVTAANWVFQFSSFSLILVILQIPFSSAVVSHEKMNFFAIVGLVDALLKLIIVSGLSLFEYDYLILYGIFTCLISLTSFAMYYIYAKRNFEEIIIHSFWDKKLFKQMLSFSTWNLFDPIAYTIQGQGLNMLMNSFFGPVVNAARGVAYQIQGAIYNFSSNTGTAFQPQMIESYAGGDYSRTKSLMYTMSKICFFMQYVLSVPIIVELDYILKLWLGNVVPQHTHNFTILILVNTIINSFNMPLSLAVHATGDIRNYKLFRCFLMVMVLPLSYFALVIDGNPENVFYCIILITLFMQPISLFLLHKVFDFSYREYFFKVIIRAVCFAFIMPLPIFLVLYMEPGLIRLVLTILITGVCSIISALYILLNKKERNEVITLAKGRVGNRKQ